MNVLEAHGLQTFYGKSHILHDVGLTVGEGEIVTLLGRNGAGKSTTLRSLIGLTPAREGTHQDLRPGRRPAWSPHRVAALGVGFVPEGRRIFANLSVDENLRVPLERQRPMDDRPRLRAISAPARAQGEQGPPAVRRRAGDARRSRAPCSSTRAC